MYKMLNFEDFPHVCKSFLEILNLRLTTRFNDKFNNVTVHLCDVLIIKLELNSEIKEYEIMRLGCLALRGALEYKINPNSNYYDTVHIKYNEVQMQNLKDELEKHLNHFDVAIIPYNVSFLRFNALVEYNCKAAKEIFAGNVSSGVIEWYNTVIKYISHALYEILEWRMTHRYHIRYDVLMKFNCRILKEVLKLKINTMHKVGEEYNPTSKFSRTEYLLFKMHKDLLQEIYYYLEE